MGSTNHQSPDSTTATDDRISQSRDRIRRSLPVSQVGLSGGLIVLAIIFSNTSPYFLTVGNFSNIGRAISVFAIMAAVATIVIISGGLDLSIGSVLVLTGYAVAAGLDAGMPLLVAVIFAVVVGALAGSFNAFIIVNIGVNPIIGTIGTLFMFRGFAILWSGGRSLIVDDPLLRALGDGSWLGIPFPLFLTALVYAVVFVFLQYTRGGLHVRAIGGSEDAARLAGLPVRRIRWMVYIASAVGTAIAGVILVGISGAAIPVVSGGIELLVIGAVILGGTALGGGRGTVGGTFLGVLVFGILRNGLTLVGVGAAWLFLFQGSALVLAVVFDERRKKRREKATGRVE